MKMRVSIKDLTRVEEMDGMKNVVTKVHALFVATYEDGVVKIPFVIDMDPPSGEFTEFQELSEENVSHWLSGLEFEETIAKLRKRAANRLGYKPGKPKETKGLPW